MDNEVFERLHRGMKEIESLFLDTLNKAQRDHEKKLIDAERNNERTNLKLLFIDQEKLERDLRTFKKVKDQITSNLQTLATTSGKPTGLTTVILEQIINETIDSFSLKYSQYIQLLLLSMLTCSLTSSPKNLSMNRVEDVLNQVRRQLLNSIDRVHLSHNDGRKTPSSFPGHSSSSVTKIISDAEAGLKKLMSTNDWILHELNDSKSAISSAQNELSEIKDIINKATRSKSFENLKQSFSVLENAAIRIDISVGKHEGINSSLAETQRRTKEMIAQLEAFSLTQPSREETPRKLKLDFGLTDSVDPVAKGGRLGSKDNDQIEQLFMYLRPLLASGERLREEINRFSGLSPTLGEEGSPITRKAGLYPLVEEFASNAKVVGGLLNSIHPQGSEAVSHQASLGGKDYYIPKQLPSRVSGLQTYSANYLVSPINKVNKTQPGGNRSSLTRTAHNLNEQDENQLLVRTLRIENTELQKEITRLNGTVENLHERMEGLQKDNMQIRFSAYAEGNGHQYVRGPHLASNGNGAGDDFAGKLHAEYNNLLQENGEIKRQLKKVTKKAEERKISLKKLFEILNSKNNELEDFKKQTQPNRHQGHISPPPRIHTATTPTGAGQNFPSSVVSGGPSHLPNVSLLLIQQIQANAEKNIQERSNNLESRYNELLQELETKTVRLEKLEAIVNNLQRSSDVQGSSSRQGKHRAGTTSDVPDSEDRYGRELFTGTKGAYTPNARLSNQQPGKFRETAVLEDEARRLKIDLDRERELVKRQKEELHDQRVTNLRQREELTKKEETFKHKVRELEGTIGELEQQIEGSGELEELHEVWNSINKLLVQMECNNIPPGPQEGETVVNSCLSGLRIAQERLEEIIGEKVAEMEGENVRRDLDQMLQNLLKEKEGFFAKFSQILEKNEFIPIRGDIKSHDDIIQMLEFMIDDYSFLKNDVTSATKVRDEEVLHLKQENNHLTEELTWHQKELSLRKSEVDVLTEKVTTQDKTIQNLKKSNSSSEDLTKHLQSEITRLRNELVDGSKASSQASASLQANLREASDAKQKLEAVVAQLEGEKAIWTKEKRNWADMRKSLENDLALAKARLDELQGEADSLSTELAETKELVAILTAKESDAAGQLLKNTTLLDALSNEKKSLTQTLAIKDEEIVRLAREKGELLAERDTLSSELDETKDQVNKLSGNVETLKRDLKTVQNENNGLKETLKILQNQDTSTGHKLSGLQKEVMDSNKKLNAAIAERDDLKASLSKLRQSLDDTKTEGKTALEDLKHKASAAEEGREKAVALLAQREKELSELQLLNNRLRGHEDLMGNMSSILGKINNTVNERNIQRDVATKKKLEKLEKEVEEGRTIFEEVAQKTRIIEDLQVSLDNEIEKHHQTSDALKKAQKDLATKEAEIKAMSSTQGERQKDTSKAVIDLKAKIGELEQRDHENTLYIERLTEDRDDLINQVKLLKSTFEVSLKQTLGVAWKGVYEGLDEKMEVFEAQIENLSAAVAQGKSKLSVLKKKYSEEQGKARQAKGQETKLSQRISELEKEVASLTNEKNNLVAKIDEANNQVAKSKAEAENLRKEKEKTPTSAGKEERSGKVLELEKINQELSKKVKELEGAAAELEIQKTKSAGFMKLIQEQDREIGEINEKLRNLPELEEQKDKLEEQVKDLNKKLDDAKKERPAISSRSNPSKEFTNQIAELQKEIADKVTAINDLEGKISDLQELLEAERERFEEEKHGLIGEIKDLRGKLEAKQAEPRKDDLREDTINIPDMGQGASDPFDEIINDPSYIIEKETGGGAGQNQTPDNYRGHGHFIQKSGDTNLRDIPQEDADRLMAEVKILKVTEEQLRTEIRDHQNNEEKFRLQFQIFKEEIVHKEEEVILLKQKLEEMAQKMNSSAHVQEKEQMKKIFVRFMENIVAKNVTEVNNLLAVLLRFLNANEDEKRIVTEYVTKLTKKKGFFN